MLLAYFPADTFEGDDFQQLLRKSKERGWFLDRTFKDFSTEKAQIFMVFLAEASE
jgi:hypothetical protein